MKAARIRPAGMHSRFEELNALVLKIKDDSGMTFAYTVVPLINIEARGKITICTGFATIGVRQKHWFDSIFA
jgi:hypothetical protein